MSISFKEFSAGLIKDLRENGGKATSGPFVGRDVLILTTKGAKSGVVRENPLAFSRDNGNYIVIASKGGAPTHPSWYHNLVANPTVTVEARGQRLSANARVAEGKEHDRLYAQMGAMSAAFHEYQKKTARKIPVVILEPIK